MMTTATTRGTTTRATTTAVARGAAGVALALALLVPGLAHASDASFRGALGRWSHRISADARGIGLSAVNRHPRRMTARALHFRADALRAHRALSLVAVSSARGRRAKRLSLAAFRQYVLVGALWARAGRARVAHHPHAATKDARLGAAHATRGNALLIAAGKLLR
jgi:hypothetical protein